MYDEKRAPPATLDADRSELLVDHESVDARPFYHRFAWAYDLLITDPVEPFVNRVVSTLADRGLGAPGRLLDAGCGTGRYARELARRGFAVEAIDASPELIEQATAKSPGDSAPVRFAVADILTLEPSHAFDAALCRGVLNDFVGDTDRQAAILHLAGALRPGGVLMLDVRDWSRSVERIEHEPVVEMRVQQGGREVSFRSERYVDARTKLIRSDEVFILNTPGALEETRSSFVMEPWSEAELRNRLASAGLVDIECETGTRHRTSDSVADRIFCIASRSEGPADSAGELA